MLRQHIVVHTKEKPYVCEYVYQNDVFQNGVRCDKSYTQLHRLEKHKQTHAAERIIYKCAHPSCAKVVNYIFLNKSFLLGMRYSNIELASWDYCIC
ncbi:unnamed protein product [Meloidogyne enterolobii]|uniref:Uncharacterized protein n=2 Tax=Meloidogyne enterolobii TaxID=390850 RepID=A0ACB0XWD8_MELEN